MCSKLVTETAHTIMVTQNKVDVTGFCDSSSAINVALRLS